MSFSFLPVASENNFGRSKLSRNVGLPSLGDSCLVDVDRESDYGFTIEPFSLFGNPPKEVYMRQFEIKHAFGLILVSVLVLFGAGPAFSQEPFY